MKVFFNVPKPGEQQQFYTRYATLVPTLEKLGYLAQVVSALTEYGILYAVVYNSLAPFWPEVAPGAAVAGAAVGTLFLELGLRKFIPYAARAVILKRYRGWDGWITGFVLAVAVGLLSASGLLSFKGSGLMVEAVAPPPVVKTTAAPDSTALAAQDAATVLLTASQQSTRARYAELIEATETTARADVRELDNQLRGLIDKEDRTGKSYATRKGRVRDRVAAVTAAKERKLASLQTDRANKLAALQTDYRAQVNGIDDDRRTARRTVAQDNDRARTDSATRVANYGGGLAYFTLFCLLVFVVCVIIHELHRAGAGIAEQVEPGAFDFEAGPLAAVTAAVSARINRKLYGVIHRLERTTTDAPEPVTAPVVWTRPGTDIHTGRTQGARRKLKPAKPAKAPAATVAAQRRQIGFAPPAELPQDATRDASPTDALTDCVKDATQATAAHVPTGVCDHCGNDYEQRTTWQRFCQTQCRKDHHAAQHDGSEFDPTRKPWNA
jgi:hypothetical protein